MSISDLFKDKYNNNPYKIDNSDLTNLLELDQFPGEIRSVNPVPGHKDVLHVDFMRNKTFPEEPLVQYCTTVKLGEPEHTGNLLEQKHNIASTPVMHSVSLNPTTQATLYHKCQGDELKTYEQLLDFSLKAVAKLARIQVILTEEYANRGFSSKPHREYDSDFFTPKLFQNNRFTYTHADAKQQFASVLENKTQMILRYAHNIIGHGDAHDENFMPDNRANIRFDNLNPQYLDGVATFDYNHSWTVP